MNFLKKASGPSSPGIPLTPMIDVVFLLLCFFVTSQIFAQWETEIDIALPTADTGMLPQRLPGDRRPGARDEHVHGLVRLGVDRPHLVGRDDREHHPTLRAGGHPVPSACLTSTRPGHSATT